MSKINYKFGFVILHYLSIDDTIKCVDSIVSKIDTNNYNIVIIDNNSSNGSGLELQKIYKSNSKIDVMLNSVNLGFSGGNNVGFKYIKDTYKCDFICVMNNDTYLIQDDFTSCIYNEYENSKFAVLGPEIHLPHNQIEILTKNLISVKSLKKQIITMKQKILFNYLFIESLILFLKKTVKKVINYNEEHSYYKKQKYTRTTDVVLHGCCLIFSSIYIKKFDGFDNKTFLYKEEEFLYLRLKNNNMLSVYNPNIKIFHSEDASTNQLLKRAYKKRRFIYKYNLIASKALLQEMENKNENFSCNDNV